jgi:hypothetical protein
MLSQAIYPILMHNIDVKWLKIVFELLLWWAKVYNKLLAM